MTTRRSYQDACAASHGLDLVGERWALLVVRELMLGPKRFTDLKTGLPGISPNVLAQRITELEEDGIVRRRKLPPPASAWIYELTDWGLELEPVIMSLGRWASRSPRLQRGFPMGGTSLMLSLRTMFSPAAAGDDAVGVQLCFGEDRFLAEVRDGALRAERGELDAPDVVLTGDPTAVAGIVHGRVPVETFVASGALGVEGDREALARFAAMFPRL